jgi:hypothetical protein
MIQNKLISYFSAEKRGAFLLFGLALAGLAAAFALVMLESSYQAAAWPLGGVALAELGIAFGLVIRTEKQIAMLLEQLRHSPLAMAHSELARMRRVMRTFMVALLAELAVLFAGMAVVVAGVGPDAWFAAALGCLLQAGVLLVFDLFARRRAAHYMKVLNATIRVYA